MDAPKEAEEETTKEETRGLIYKVTAPNGRGYVGETIRTLAKRWSDHCCVRSCCVNLKRAILKYGRENMKVEVLEADVPWSKLIERETHYILEHGTLVPHGYNIRIGTGRKVSTDDPELVRLSYHGGQEKPKNKCVDCGKEVYRNSKRCDKCNGAARHARNVLDQQRLSAEQIIADVEAMGYSKTGAKYSVSDNAVRSWLKGYEKHDEEAAVHIKAFRERWKNKTRSDKCHMQKRPVPEGLTHAALKAKIDAVGYERTVVEYRSNYNVVKRWLSELAERDA